MKRRTREDIKVAEAKTVMADMGLDPNSEKGQEYLQKVKDKYKAKTTKTNPDLTKAKKERQKAKSALMALDRAAKTIMELSSKLYEENVNKVRETMEQANLAVKMLEGNDMKVVTKYLDEYMQLVNSPDKITVDN